MVSTINDAISIFDVKLSSVVPATVTEEGKVHELTCMDLAMKLHYIKGLYFFINENNKGGENNEHYSISSDDLAIKDVKKSMFSLLDPYYRVAGRIRRRTENGRPYIKCNDCGVRIVEAQCDRTVEEVLLAMDDDETLYKNFVYSRVIGPDTGFSPLVFMQFTWFKCGGVSLGLSWAHVLGDVFSAVAFINWWGSAMAGNPPPKSLALPECKTFESDVKVPKNPLYFKPINPIGDIWTIANTTKMETRSFHLNSKQVSNLKKAVLAPAEISLFETLVTILWKSIANIRKEMEPKCVTICRKSSRCKENEAPSNNQSFSTVEADFTVGEADVVDLAQLIYERSRNAPEEPIEKSREIEDLIVYGANLTFVDLTEANIYGVKVKGHKLIYGSYIIDGIGDEGAVLVLPGKENGGLVLKITLPENQFADLRNELKTNWDIA